MKSSIEIFKEKKIRVTQQRLEVYEALLSDGGHLTAERIYEKIRTKIPAVSLATVYSILDLFKEKNLVGEIRIKFDKSCFEARADFHHHFLCKKCQKIYDINMTPCASLEKRKVNGHRIEELQGYFYGVCRECQ